MITIRKIKEADAERYLQLRRQLDHETEFMMLEPGERTTGLEEEQTQIFQILQRENQTTFVVETDGELVGYLAATGGSFRRNKHCAYIVIGILQASSGQGLGTKLFIEAEQWANQQGIHRLELTVMAHNEAGIRLYKKMGFETEGIKRDSLYVDGKYIDEYYMAKLL